MCGRPPSQHADRRAGLAVVVGIGLGLIEPALGAMGTAGVFAGSWWAARRRRRTAETALHAELPDVVDLFALAVGAGLNVTMALRAVGQRAGGTVGAALVEVDRAVSVGCRLADELAALPDRLGEPVRPFVDVLLACVRYGSPAGPSLDRLAAELRVDRRRRAEEAIRRVPVKLLFPLVLCTLPAFALLTVVPLLGGALGSLQF